MDSQNTFSQRIRKNRQKKLKFHLPTLVISVVITSILLGMVGHSLNETAINNARLQAESKLNALDRTITSCTTAAISLAELVTINGGAPADFDMIAANIYDESKPISSVQLAPGGVVTYVYPEQGNQAGKIDLFSDSQRKDEAIASKDSGKMMVAGPFTLKQGGFGMALRQPVYMKKGDVSSFWGFAIVIADMHEVLNECTFETLDKLHYPYELTAIVDEKEVFVSGEENVKDAECITQTIAGKQWNLYIAPPASSNALRVFWLLCIIMYFLDFALAAMASLIIDKNEANITDPLTGIRNRRGFDEALARMSEDKHLKRAYIIAIDLNNFKAFNDRYGHDAGDVLLKTLAEEMKNFVGRAGIVSRNGGDEFQMLFRNPDNSWMENLHDFFNRDHHFKADGKEYKYNISGGLAVYPDMGNDFLEIFKKADIAMYHAKMDHGERLALYDPSMKEEPRENSGFNFKDLAGGAPASVLIYKDDAEQEILYANRECLRLFECENMTDFMKFCNYSFRSLIFEEDRDWTLEAMKKQHADPVQRGYAYLSYRIRTLSGKGKQVMYIGRAINHEFYGNINYVLLWNEEDIALVQSSEED